MQVDSEYLQESSSTESEISSGCDEFTTDVDHSPSELGNPTKGLVPQQQGKSKKYIAIVFEGFHCLNSYVSKVYSLMATRKSKYAVQIKKEDLQKNYRKNRFLKEIFFDR